MSLRSSALACVGALLAASLTASPPASADAVGGGGTYVAVPYTRIMDTKSGLGGSSQPFAPNEQRSYTILGRNGVPSTGVAAVLVDLAATEATAVDTQAYLWASGAPRPSVSTFRYGAATVPRSSALTVPVGTDGKITVQSGNGTTDLNLDIQGYFTASGNSSAAPGGYVSQPGIMVLDTVEGVGAPAAKIGSNSSVTVQVTGSKTGVPADAGSVFVNIKAQNISNDGELRLGPAGGSSTRPILNFSYGGPEHTGGAVELSATGAMTVTNTGPSGVNVRVLVEGYFSKDPSKGGGFHALTHTALLDTTTGSALAPGATLDVAVGGQAGVPMYGVGGAVLGVIAQGYTASGSLEVYPTGHSDGPSPVSFIGAEGGVGNAVTTVVRPGNNGMVTVKNSSSGPVDVRIRLQGWFDTPKVLSAEAETSFRSGATQSGYSNDWIEQAVYDLAMVGSTQVADVVEQDATELATSSMDFSKDQSTSADYVDETGASYDPVLLRATSKCRRLKTKITGANVLEQTLWTFKQVSDWCYNGDKITYRESNYYVTEDYTGWDFKGLVDGGDKSIPGPPWVRYRMGKFQQCIPMPWGEYCAWTKYPWIRHEMRANGTYVISRGIT